MMKFRDLVPVLKCEKLIIQSTNDDATVSIDAQKYINTKVRVIELPSMDMQDVLDLIDLFERTVKKVESVNDNMFVELE